MTMVGASITNINQLSIPRKLLAATVPVAKSPAKPVPEATSPTFSEGYPFMKPTQVASPMPDPKPVNTLKMIAIQKKILLSLYSDI